MENQLPKIHPSLLMNTLNVGKRISFLLKYIKFWNFVLKQERPFEVTDKTISVF